MLAAWENSYPIRVRVRLVFCVQLLIKVATERQEMLPALVYEARPTRGPYVPNQMTRRAVGQGAYCFNWLFIRPPQLHLDRPPHLRAG